MTTPKTLIRTTSPMRPRMPAARWLLVMLAGYAVLTGVEVVRRAVFAPPIVLSAGTYPAEVAAAAGGERSFRWSRGATASVLRPIAGRVVRLPLYAAHPGPPIEGVHVTLHLGDRLVDRRTLRRNGWHLLDYYLPPVLGSDPWAENPAQMSLAGFGVLQPGPIDAPFGRLMPEPRAITDAALLLVGWGRRAGPPSMWWHVRSATTFVPARHGAPGDTRELGIGVGEPLWLEQLPAAGVGVYAEEGHTGEPFRWTRGWGSLAFRAPSGAIAIDLRSRPAAPAAVDDPVQATFFWNQHEIAAVVYTDADWRTDRLVLPGELVAGRGVISVRVSRTWNPAVAGDSADDRDLGLALGRPRWIVPQDVDAGPDPER